MRTLFNTAVMVTLTAAVWQAASIANAADATTFTITIRNVSAADTLKLPDGMAISAPIAPGVYAVIRGDALIFRPGQAADHTLESLAEDGDATALLTAVTGMNGVVAAEIFVPGLPLTVSAEPGDRLVFASMFVQSNDKFFAPEAQGIELFDGLNPISGDLSSKVLLWDAGTEEDEVPGIGPNQAPRQAGPNSGPDEHAVVRPADDGFAYPAVSDVVQLAILPLVASSEPDT